MGSGDAWCVSRAPSQPVKGVASEARTRTPVKARVWPISPAFHCDGRAAASAGLFDAQQRLGVLLGVLRAELVVVGANAARRSAV